MPILRQIVQSLSKEEVRAFKIFLSRIQTQTDRKVVQLFDALRNNANVEFDEERFIIKLFGNSNRNAYYQIRKRLRDYIDRSQHDFIFGKEDIYVFQLLTIGRNFFKKQQYTVCWDYLKKAQKLAEQLELFEAQDLILSEMIRTAIFIPEVNPEKLIEQRSLVRKRLQALNELDEILTVLGYRLAISQQTGKQESQLGQTLEDVLNRYQQEPILKEDNALRIRLMEGICQVMLQKHAYKAMADYLSANLPQAISDRMFSKANHEIRLKLLTWWTNALFKSNQLQESLRVAVLLKNAMEAYDSMLSDKYFIFYNSAMVYANTVLNMPEAIRILEETISNPALEKHPMYSLVVHLNLVLCLYESKDPRKALKVLSQTYVHPAFLQADKVFRLKIGITELIIRATQDQWETIITRTNQLRKDAADPEIELFANGKITDFLHIFQTLAKRDGEISKNTHNLIQSWIDQYAGDPAEADVINYSAWLVEWFSKSK
jgi:hypothetical protein